MNSNSSRDIPGYFWDAEKRRYFKVEQNHHAARHDAPWSSDNIKKRKLNDLAASERARHEARSKNRITRSRVFNEPLMGGFLSREYGDDVGDLHSASFAHGLVEKGKISVDDELPFTNLDAMFVLKKKSKHGVYPVLSHNTSLPWITISSIAMDNKTGRIQRTPPDSIVHCVTDADADLSDSTGITDIKCNATESRAFVSFIRIGAGSTTIFFSFNLHGRLDAARQIIPYALPFPCTSNTICTSPPGHAIQCLVGSNLGLAAIDDRNHLKLITPTEGRQDLRSSLFKDIFGVDYHATNPNLVFFGGRPGRLFIGDLRQEAYEWSSIQLPKSISHVHAVNDNQVLVAGLESMMSVYDVRFCDRVKVKDNLDTPWGPRRKKGGNPIVTMPEYKNQSRFNAGFDFDRSLGIAAAAHEDGKVALYSVRSGRRLPSRDIDKIYSPRGPIHHLQFQTLEGNHTPTLFVGEGSSINAFSFGVDNFDDEC